MKEITAEELKSALESGTAVTVLDIREAGEHETWSIPGSRNLPVYEALRGRNDAALTSRADSLPRGVPVVAVCRMGVVSKKAARILEGLGFEATSLAGGMRDWGGVWSTAPLPLTVPGASAIQVRRPGKGCLSYVVASNGEAAVVDPSVDVEAYVAIAEREGCRVARVLETHVHADHLSRALALARKTGANLHLPANDRVTFDYEALRDGDRIEIGAVTVEVVATPGHTGESVSYLVGGELLLSGDTLFVEAVGRPDLERGDEGARAAARRLHESLTRRLLVLPGGTTVCPCHHPRPIPFDGEPVAARLEEVKDRVEILGLDEASFVERIVRSLGAKPPNFEAVIAVNEGKADLGGVDPLDLEAGPNRCAAG